MSIDHVGSVLAEVEQRMLNAGVNHASEEDYLTSVLMATLIVELRAIAGILSRIDTTLASGRK